MIKVFLLIVEPVPTWDRIVAAQRKWGLILLGHVVPVLLLVCFVEGYGLVHWGKPRGQVPHNQKFSISQAAIFEAAQFILSVGIVFLGAKLLKSLGETFHGRHTFGQTFTLAAYSLTPLFVLRMLDAFSAISPWLTWGVGIVLSSTVLYSGLPRVMQPDPPHAFGLYLISVVLLLIVSGLVCFLTTWYLQGKFPALDQLVRRLTGP